MAPSGDANDANDDNDANDARKQEKRVEAGWLSGVCDLCVGARASRV